MTFSFKRQSKHDIYRVTEWACFAARADILQPIDRGHGEYSWRPEPEPR